MVSEWVIWDGFIYEQSRTCWVLVCSVCTGPAASIYSAMPVKHHPTGKQWCPNTDHYSDSERARRSLALMRLALSRAAEPQILTSFVWRGRGSNHQPPACQANAQPLHYPDAVTNRRKCPVLNSNPWPWPLISSWALAIRAITLKSVTSLNHNSCQAETRDRRSVSPTHFSNNPKPKGGILRARTTGISVHVLACIHRPNNGVLCRLIEVSINSA